MAISKWGVSRIYNLSYEEEKGIKSVIKWEVLRIPRKCRLRITRLEVLENTRPQGVRIAVDCGEGSISIDGQVASEHYIWLDDSNPIRDLDVEANSGLISIFNICWYDDHPTRKIWAQGDWMGMLVEESDNALIYRCNDCFFSSSFNSLIFSVEFIDEVGNPNGRPAPVLDS